MFRLGAAVDVSRVADIINIEDCGLFEVIDWLPIDD
jgi:hypothetical protein